jgi:hypothetical protein
MLGQALEICLKVLVPILSLEGMHRSVTSLKRGWRSSATSLVWLSNLLSQLSAQLGGHQHQGRSMISMAVGAIDAAEGIYISH